MFFGLFTFVVLPLFLMISIRKINEGPLNGTLLGGILKLAFIITIGLCFAGVVFFIIEIIESVS